MKAASSESRWRSGVQGDRAPDESGFEEQVVTVESDQGTAELLLLGVWRVLLLEGGGA